MSNKSEYSEYIEEEIISLYDEEKPFVSIFLDLSNTKLYQENITEHISTFIQENKSHFKYLDLVYIQFNEPNFETFDLTKLPQNLIYNLEFCNNKNYFDIITNDQIKVDRILFSMKDSNSLKFMENTYLEALKIKSLKNFTISSTYLCKINYTQLQKFENMFKKKYSESRGFFSLGKNIVIVNPVLKEGSLNNYFGKNTDKYFQYPLIKFRTTYLPCYPSKFFSQHLENYPTKYITE